jgi:multiple sugar transport system permease protein
MTAVGSPPGDAAAGTSIVSGRGARSRGPRDRAWAFLLPAYGAIIAVVGIPVLYSLYLSFHQWKLATFKKGVPFVGLDNYARALADDGFWHSLQVTVTFTLAALVLEVVLGVGLAVLMDQDVRGRRTTRILLLLPMFVTNVVIGLIWRILLSYDFGVVNWFLSLFGIPKVAWLGDPSLALWSLVVVDVWNTTAFVALIVLAGLQAIPDEPRQAARVDGASSWQVFRLVTLPLLRPVLFVAVVWRTVDLFRIFDVVFSLTGGGPYNATETISLYAYNEGFASFNLGLASAISYLIILGLVIILAIEARLLGRPAT